MGADVYWSNGRNAAAFFFSSPHSTTCRPTSGKRATHFSPRPPSPEGWNVGTVGRKRRGTGYLPSVAASCGRVVRLSARAICSSFGRQQAELLRRGERMRKERAETGEEEQEYQGVMCMREDECCQDTQPNPE